MISSLYFGLYVTLSFTFFEFDMFDHSIISYIIKVK